MRDLRKHGEIPPEAAKKGETEKLHEKQTWFQNPVNCMSKLSKALKMGIAHSMGLDIEHTSLTNSGENDKHGFLFIL